MSYLEKAKQAIEARSVFIALPRCSRCLELDAAGIAVLACPCGYTPHRSRRPERTAEDREVLRQAVRASRGRVRGCGQLRLVEGRGDG